MEALSRLSSLYDRIYPYRKLLYPCTWQAAADLQQTPGNWEQAASWTLAACSSIFVSPYISGSILAIGLHQATVSLRLVAQALYKVCSAPAITTKEALLEKDAMISTPDYDLFASNTNRAILLYPGYSVPHTAYRRLARAMCHQGLSVVLVSTHPHGLATAVSLEQIGKIQNEVAQRLGSDIEWWVGGHSLGGLAATRVRNGQGLILLATAPVMHLAKETNLPMLRILVENDAVVPYLVSNLPQAEQDWKHRYPQCVTQTLEGTHGGFGDYLLPGQAQASNHDIQQAQAVAWILEFVQETSNAPIAVSSRSISNLLLSSTSNAREIDSSLPEIAPNGKSPKHALPDVDLLFFERQEHDAEMPSARVSQGADSPDVMTAVETAPTSTLDTKEDGSNDEAQTTAAAVSVQVKKQDLQEIAAASVSDGVAPEPSVSGSKEEAAVSTAAAVDEKAESSQVSSVAELGKSSLVSPGDVTRGSESLGVSASEGVSASSTRSTDTSAHVLEEASDPLSKSSALQIDHVGEFTAHDPSAEKVAPLDSSPLLANSIVMMNDASEQVVSDERDFASLYSSKQEEVVPPSLSAASDTKAATNQTLSLLESAPVPSLDQATKVQEFQNASEVKADTHSDQVMTVLQNDCVVESSANGLSTETVSPLDSLPLLANSVEVLNDASAGQVDSDDFESLSASKQGKAVPPSSTSESDTQAVMNQTSSVTEFASSPPLDQDSKDQKLNNASVVTTASSSDQVKERGSDEAAPVSQGVALERSSKVVVTFSAAGNNKSECTLDQVSLDPNSSSSEIGPTFDDTVVDTATSSDSRRVHAATEKEGVPSSSNLSAAKSSSALDKNSANASAVSVSKEDDKIELVKASETRDSFSEDVPAIDSSPISSNNVATLVDAPGQVASDKRDFEALSASKQNEDAPPSLASESDTNAVLISTSSLPDLKRKDPPENVQLANDSYSKEPSSDVVEVSVLKTGHEGNGLNSTIAALSSVEQGSPSLPTSGDMDVPRDLLKEGADSESPVDSVTAPGLDSAMPIIDEDAMPSSTKIVDSVVTEGEEQVKSTGTSGVNEVASTIAVTSEAVSMSSDAFCMDEKEAASTVAVASAAAVALQKQDTATESTAQVSEHFKSSTHLNDLSAKDEEFNTTRDAPGSIPGSEEKSSTMYSPKDTQFALPVTATVDMLPDSKEEIMSQSSTSKYTSVSKDLASHSLATATQQEADSAIAQGTSGLGGAAEIPGDTKSHHTLKEAHEDDDVMSARPISKTDEAPGMVLPVIETKDATAFVSRDISNAEQLSTQVSYVTSEPSLPKEDQSQRSTVAPGSEASVVNASLPAMTSKDVAEDDDIDSQAALPDEDNAWPVEHKSEEPIALSTSNKKPSDQSLLPVYEEPLVEGSYHSIGESTIDSQVSDLPKKSVVVSRPSPSRRAAPKNYIIPKGSLIPPRNANARRNNDEASTSETDSIPSVASAATSTASVASKSGKQRRKKKPAPPRERFQV